MTGYIFWIQSSRGTDDLEVHAFPRGTKREIIRQKLREWCENFGCWNSSNNYINYGFRRVKLLPRQELKQKLKEAKELCEKRNKTYEEFRERLPNRKLEKQWKFICDKRRTAQKKYDVLRSMANL